jgi:integrase
MAIVVKKPTSRNWFAAFRDATGRQHRISTGTTDRARAQRIAEQYERAAQKRGNPQQVREAFASLYREFYGEDLPSATVRNYAERWLATKRPETSIATRVIYEKATAKLLDFLGPDADREIALISRDKIVRFRNELVRSLAPATVNRDLRVTKSIFRSARREGYLGEDPAEGVKPVKNRSENTRRPLTIQEIQAVLSVADSEWKSLIKFGIYTGQRLGDIARLTWQNVDLERGELRLVSVKTGKRLILPIAGPLREHMLTLAAGESPETPLHPRAWATIDRQGRVAMLSNQFNELLAEAGLRAPPRQSRNGKRLSVGLGFHCLRHTAVSLLKDAGVPDAVVMALVGHTSAAMSHRYTHVGRESLEKAAAALPEI